MFFLGWVFDLTNVGIFWDVLGCLDVKKHPSTILFSRESASSLVLFEQQLVTFFFFFFFFFEMAVCVSCFLLGRKREEEYLWESKLERKRARGNQNKKGIRAKMGMERGWERAQ